MFEIDWNKTLPMRTHLVDRLSFFAGVATLVFVGGHNHWDALSMFVSFLVILPAMAMSMACRNMLEKRYSGDPPTNSSFWRIVTIILVLFAIALHGLIIDKYPFTAPAVTILGISLLELVAVLMLQYRWSSHSEW